MALAALISVQTFIHCRDNRINEYTIEAIEQNEGMTATEAWDYYDLGLDVDWIDNLQASRVSPLTLWELRKKEKLDNMSLYLLTHNDNLDGYGFLSWIKKIRQSSRHPISAIMVSH